MLIQNVANGLNPTTEHTNSYLEKIELSLDDRSLDTERASYALETNGSKTIPSWRNEYFESLH